MKKLSEVYKKLGIAFTFPIKIKDEKGNQTYCEESNGFWYRYEYDKDGNKTYYEDSDGFWSKWEYDEKGKVTYCETSSGYKKGTKRSSCDGKVIEVDGKKYKLTAVKDYEYKAPAWVNWPV
jgi:YD repeat-containing protein